MNEIVLFRGKEQLLIIPGIQFLLKTGVELREPCVEAFANIFLSISRNLACLIMT